MTHSRAIALLKTLYYLFVLLLSILGVLATLAYSVYVAKQPFEIVIANFSSGLIINIMAVAVLYFLARQLLYAPQEEVFDEVRAELRKLSDLSEGLLLDKADTGITRAFPHESGFDWLPYIRGAKEITVTKLRINWWDSAPYYEAMEEVLRRGGSVTLAMPDPRCPAMWLRYREEPTLMLRRPDEPTWVRGLEQLADVFQVLYNWKTDLKQKGVNVDKLFIGAFTHYPTQALYQFDQRIFVFGYPYLERGFHAPMFMFTNRESTGFKFYERCIKSSIQNAQPIENVIDDIIGQRDSGLLHDTRVLKAELSIEIKS